MTPERRARLDGVLNRRQPDLTVLAENLHKPRNLSAVVRTCDAVGVAGIHVVPGETNVRKHWHTSQGAEKWVELQVHDTTQGACEHLRAEGFTILAAHLSDDAVDYREVDYTRPTALLIGTEAFGVSDEGLRWVDREIVIPMMGMSQSLNVSVATAVVLYEAVAQRRAAGMFDASRMPSERHARMRFEWLHPTVARYCRERGLPYPELDEDGELVSDPRIG
ncbi:MAG: tRNA (guanosine(18)-2'-O)-methyltransferase TrmH [Xanthomonadales bacterium]|nr:tRNA (guanosine(18)-2'-O)-methyltransferase TrmH [Xanthomonadales bacterium]